MEPSRDRFHELSRSRYPGVSRRGLAFHFSRIVRHSVKEIRDEFDEAGQSFKDPRGTSVVRRMTDIAWLSALSPFPLVARGPRGQETRASYVALVSSARTTVLCVTRPISTHVNRFRKRLELRPL